MTTGHGGLTTSLAPSAISLIPDIILDQIQHDRHSQGQEGDFGVEIASPGRNLDQAVGSTFPELLAHDDFDTPADYAMTNAREKALEVYRTLTINGQQPPDLVIGADTVVVYEPPAANAGERAIILEKPNDEAHAKQMLITLRNAKTHGVVTGMCFVFPPSADVVEADDGGDAGEPKVVTFFEHTSVTFGSQVTDAMIDAYVATGDPLDKAGAYGYQSKAMFLVERIDGCHFNVVGLPVYRMVVELQHHIK